MGFNLINMERKGGRLMLLNNYISDGEIITCYWVTYCGLLEHLVIHI